jgi:hypothetical protein
MRNSLLGGLTVALAASGSASASVWTITGASIAGVSQPVSSMRSGVIDIGTGSSLDIQAALDDEFDAQAPGTPLLSLNTLAFFAFQDTGGTEYFGFYWLSNTAKQLTLTASASGASGYLTNTSIGANPSGATYSSQSSGDSYFYLFSGVGAGSTISMSGLVPNLEIQWLDWDGAAWQLLGDGSRTGVSPGNESFGLGVASAASAVPGAGLAGLAGGGVVGRLLGRRRDRGAIAGRA